MRNLLLAAGLVLAAGCGSVYAPGSATAPPPGSTVPSVTPAAGQPPLHLVHDPGMVTGRLVGPCHTRDGGQIPDPRCTPGAYDPAITAAILCAPGYTTRSYRAPESETKRA